MFKVHLTAWVTALLLGMSWPAVGWASAGGPKIADPLVPGPNGEVPTGWVQTQWGAFGPVDRSLVEGVRRADLWEGPAGQMAATKGVHPRVREIGAMISGQHVRELDPLVLKVAEQLDIAAPTEPTAEQQGWLAEMRQAEGTAFDQIFVDRLRAAHAKVFALIATVRANTRNSVIRDFAQTANKYVDGHIAMLDSTNLVSYQLLPTPAAAAPPGQPVGSGVLSSVRGGMSPLIIWIVLLTAVVAGAATVVRIIRPR